MNRQKNREKKMNKICLWSKLGTLKRQAYGFRDMEYFKPSLHHLHKSRYSFVGQTNILLRRCKQNILSL